MIYWVVDDKMHVKFSSTVLAEAMAKRFTHKVVDSVGNYYV